MKHIVPSIDDGSSLRKKCSRCEKVKPLGDFAKNKQSKDGYHSHCKVCHGMYWQTYKEETPIQLTQKINHLLRTYGLSYEEYLQMFQEQQGCCAACHNPQTLIHYGKTLPLAVDHCHTTGAVRGLLCKACNQALGLLDENPERIALLLKYVNERVLW